MISPVIRAITPRHNTSASKECAGVSLVEAMCALAVLAVAATAVFSLYTANLQAGRFSEERRLALQAAVEKIEEIRRLVASGKSLDEIYDIYKPAIGMTDVNNMPPAAFRVPGLRGRSNDSVRNEYVGTVSLIIDETPNEADYGVDYTTNPSTLSLGVDINGNNRYNDISGLAPFPMDINGNGNTTDNPMTEGFFILPVVVTVRWQGVYGIQRVDLFSIVFPDKRL